MQRSVTILGSTGTIGRQALEVLVCLKDEYAVSVLTAGRNAALLAEQICQFQPKFVSVQDETVRAELLELLRGAQFVPEIGIGDDGLKAAASYPSDIVVSSIVGARGLMPSWIAASRGATVALANKETLVAAGELFIDQVRKSGGTLLPVDSEHSALLQCLQSGRDSEAARYILTASGGPFRTLSYEKLKGVTVEQALKHPNWTMGRKITIDSATLMNKGLEVIEAHHLFDASYDKIDVVVHPQSVIHSMIEYCDGSVMAQLATPDMRLPIQYAFSFPNRVESHWSRLDLFAFSGLTFESPDTERFRSLALAYAAGRQGGFAPCVLNAANEIAVDAFLSGNVSFLDIPNVVDAVLEQHEHGVPHSIEDVLEVDAWARRAAQTVILRGGWSQ